ncbi:MAG: ComEA family DNA-binding protein [Flammeovirgaceae bacterium]
MKRFTYWIRNYFGFSQTETKGFFVLSTLLIFIIFIPSFFPVDSNYTANQLVKDQAMLDSMRILLAKQHIRPARYYKQTDQAKKRNYVKPVPKKLTTFNPNLASQQKFETLGMPHYLAKRIVKYRTKGGVFRVKKDLLKIYGFPEDLYTELEPYIKIPKEKSDLEKKENRNDTLPQSMAKSEQQMFDKQPAKNKLYSPKPFLTPFDLALADTTQLKKIRGIGSKLSARIVKYRDKLGGFHSLNQLQEVYGLQPEVIAELKKYALLEHPTIQQIPINTADVKTLAQHPYISYKLAHVIVNYREQHGAYTQVDDLKAIKLIKQAFIDKIKPYLNFKMN